MKRYTGALDKDLEVKLKDNAKVLLGLSGSNTGLNRSLPQTYSIDETVEKYNAGISKEEIQAWVWFRRKLGIPMTSWKSYFVKETKTLLFNWVKNGILFYDPQHKGYVPYAVFTFGNIYTKLAKLEKERENLIQEYGSSVYENHIDILEKIKPEPLSISSPIRGERPVILSISEFPKKFMVTSLSEKSGIILEEEMSLLNAFERWLKAYPSELIKRTSAYNIIAFYIEGQAKPRSIDKGEWGKIKKNSREEGERLFSDFLHEALTVSDKLKIDAHYNSMYNSTARLQYHKIPIGIEVSRSFMGNTLEVREAQREGIAFMELVGSGIVAYDVGVGKTITAIIEVVTAIKNGKCKRPIIAVPNPTYKNWIKEMLGEEDLAGVLTGTGITVNEWFNLGAKYKKLKLDKKVPANSITLVSYEGLMKIGFNDVTQAEHFDQLSNIVGQREGSSDRDKEKMNEKYREIIGEGLKETIADIETLGIDYVVVDEAHNFKNIFSEVKSDKGQKHFHVQGGQPSNRGIKLFFLCNYIQRKYGRNVMLLTATPFTNSPLEIYSMLSLVAHQYMKDNNILNLRQFFEQYIAETIEYVVSMDGEIKQRSVVKSFNNRISLQKLINSHINFKTGEEANIPRPCKVNLPKTTEFIEGEGIVKLKPEDQILTYLAAGEEQAEIQREINKLAQEGAQRDDPGRLLSLMADSQNNALSPFLVGKAPLSHVRHLDKGDPEDYMDFVENSPKILYALECIRTVKEHHEKTGTPVSGQVIYIDRGKDYFRYIKEYLEVELGYKKAQKLKSNPRKTVDEVEIIQGGMSTAKKEAVKDAFNEGTCKIVIGTSSIKEGINLQEKSSVLYNLYPNWNPTDIRQLEGRIWRQKNQFNFVRIVMPLMENSMDVFVFQKLEEKTSRINDLWSQSERGNVLDEESLDPNEVKFALVTDLGVLERFEIKQLREELMLNKTIAEKKLEDFRNLSKLEANYDVYKGRVMSNLRQALLNFPRLSVGYDPNGKYISYADKVMYKEGDLQKTLETKLERMDRAYDLLKEAAEVDDDKIIIRAYSAYQRVSQSYSWEYDSYKETVSELAKIQRTLFDARGLKREDIDMKEMLYDLERDVKVAQRDIDDLESDEFKTELRMEIRRKKDKYGATGVEVEDRVEEFAEMNHLLDYKFEKASAVACAVPKAAFKFTKDVKKPTKKDAALKLKLAKAKAKAILIQLELDQAA
jgi:superfamily II DNA/RNA helicase